jgi:DNA-binding NarL/FixJ family response regulator
MGASVVTVTDSVAAPTFVAVSRGESHFPSTIAARIKECESRSVLSAREIEILEMVARGLTNKEIGRVLEISHYTVRNHINHISVKLNAGDRTEAATVALQQGIINTTN